MPDRDERSKAEAGAGTGARAGAGGSAGGGSPADDLEILGAEFSPAPEGAVRISVLARGPLARAMPLLARVGEQQVSDLAVGSYGFSGSLASAPRDGDRL